MLLFDGIKACNKTPRKQMKSITFIRSTLKHTSLRAASLARVLCNLKKRKEHNVAHDKKEENREKIAEIMAANYNFLLGSFYTCELFSFRSDQTRAT